MLYIGFKVYGPNNGKGYPEGYPYECYEFNAENLADAKAMKPELHVMTIDDYTAYKNGLMQCCGSQVDSANDKAFKGKKAWWKFW